MRAVSLRLVCVCGGSYQCSFVADLEGRKEGDQDMQRRSSSITGSSKHHSVVMYMGSTSRDAKTSKNNSSVFVGGCCYGGLSAQARRGHSVAWLCRRSGGCSRDDVMAFGQVLTTRHAHIVLCGWTLLSMGANCHSTGAVISTMLHEQVAGTVGFTTSRR